jgi:anti-sigma B factor antagonist
VQINVINLTKIHTDTYEANNVAVKISASDVLDSDGANSFIYILMSLINGGVSRVIVDMNDLEFIDSLGIGTLINAAKQIRKKNGDLVLVRVPEKIDKILRPVNIQRFIKIYATDQDAIHHLKYM